MSLPLATTELASRLIDAERECVAGWLRAMEALPGNPFRVTVRAFGAATALVCGAVPAEVFNRVMGLALADAASIPDILRLYREYGARPVFDLSPYTTPLFWEQPNLMSELARHGFYHGAFHQMLYGLPTADVPAPPPDVVVKEIGVQQAREFGHVYEQVWGSGDQIRVLLGVPAFRCYLAYVDSEPAGLGVLHIVDGAASMANGLTIPAARRRGCQLALLHRRIRDAALSGCDLLVSQCRPGGTSQSNQLRAGFAIAGSKAWWVLDPELSK